MQTHACMHMTCGVMHAVMLQVEKAPVVVKSSVPKADAENLKKLLEAGKCLLHAGAACHPPHI